MLYTSFESPNIELPESEVKMGVASSRGLPRPLKCDYLLRATIFQGRLILKELRYITLYRGSSNSTDSISTVLAIVRFPISTIWPKFLAIVRFFLDFCGKSGL